MKRLRFSVCITGLFCSLVSAQQYQSADSEAQLIELFTSQGCSSCPSAERWLNQFTDSPALWHTLFPMAWHVDYWDYLGWRDRYASKDFNQRQYRYHHQGVTSGIYTPQAMVNGVEWRALLSLPRPALPEPQANAAEKLTLKVDNGQFEAFGTRHQGILNIAMLGMGLQVKIKKGENSGRKLREDFVVLGFAQYNFHADGWQGKLPPTINDLGASAVVAWTTDPVHSAPLSVAGGLLAGSLNPP